VGYYLSIFYFLARGQGKRRRLLYLGLAAFFGTAVGLARMAGGAHFASDVLWSAYIVFLVNLVLYYFVFNVPAWDDGIAVPATFRGSRTGFLVLVTALSLAVVGGIMAASPVYKPLRYGVAIPEAASPAIVDLECPDGHLGLTFRHTDSVTVEGEARGFGIPGSKFLSGLSATNAGERFAVVFHCRAHGWMTEVDVQATVTVPVGRTGRVRLRGRNAGVRVPADSVLPSGISIDVEAGELVLPESWRDASLPLNVSGGAVEYR
jgi:hypothetical protein